MSRARRWIIGIDEVGRGSLAGPVTVVAAAIPRNFQFLISNFQKRKLPLRDSKKLSAKQREMWVAYFKQHPKVSFAVARVWPKTIDRINITRAANRAALRAFLHLSIAHNLSPIISRVYLDGGLFLGDKNNTMRDTGRTIIKADEKINAVKIASIIAKVNRDRLMVRLAKKYPEYGFEIHKGYGTKRHKEAIRRHGPSDMHRKSFLRKTLFV